MQFDGFLGQGVNRSLRCGWNPYRRAEILRLNKLHELTHAQRSGEVGGLRRQYEETQSTDWCHHMNQQRPEQDINTKTKDTESAMQSATDFELS